MSEIVKCKRCGRKLTSEESIKRGYGMTCYRIIQLQNQETKPETNQELAFLKCEIKMLKRMFKQIKTSGVIIDPIERIKQDNHRPERDANRGDMANVITEMKEIFNNIENIYDLLTPVAIET